MNTRNVALTSVSILSLMVYECSQPARAAEVDEPDTIIVTGTRATGVKAQDSAAPIQVIGAEALEATGATNAFDALKELVPSFSSAAMNVDASEMVRSARLRGMNPGEVLVLVNGKRRHDSAVVNAFQDADTSSNPTDLDMIPIALIDHVEVLTDGAAAQYGSDAVAGVINIILKNSHSGTTVSAGAGITTRGDGAQGDGAFSQGIALGKDGFLDVSVNYRHIDFMNRSGINALTIGEVNPYGVANGLVRNRLWGGPLSDLAVGGFNMEKPLNEDIAFYAFGTAGWRGAQAYENNRPDSKAPTIWPDGFFPRQTLNEVDGAFTGGIKGSHLAGWDWDISATYGQDFDHLGVINTVNTGLLAATGTSGTNGSLGTEFNSQSAVNADFRRPFIVDWLAAPLNVAAGLEYRYETYALGAGDPLTYELGGTQAEQGFTPTDVSNSSRSVESVYVDLSTKLLPNWTIDLAGRFEDYSEAGVGSTEDGKLTSRYDFSSQLGIHATVSDGFHAPTLAQSNFAVTNVTPTSLSLQAPVNSPGAKLLGALPLRPETAKDVDFGIVAEPIPKLHITLDAYQIFLDHRIINSALFSGSEALAAAEANGNTVTGSGATAYVSFFNNGVDARTRGLDLATNYKSDFGSYGTVKWSLNGNYNEVAITNVYQIPTTLRTILLSSGQAPSYLNPQVITDLTKSSPVDKISLAANWSVHDFDVTLRETRYGHVDENSGVSSATVPFTNIYIKSAYITDVDVAYFVTDSVKLDVGGNNIFDHLPGHLTYAQQTPRLSGIYPNYTPWGIAGSYFYTRVSASF